MTFIYEKYLHILLLGPGRAWGFSNNSPANVSVAENAISNLFRNHAIQDYNHKIVLKQLVCKKEEERIL